MLSLRRFHEMFIIVAIVMADLFGAWAVHDYRLHAEPLILVLGIGTLLGGLALCGYVVILERKMDNWKLG